VIPPQYDDSRPFSNGLARVKLKNKWGVINRQGETVVPFIYDGIDEFSEHLACVFKGDKRGFINEEGEEVIPFNMTKLTNRPLRQRIFLRE
jgi:hypothetical protein